MVATIIVGVDRSHDAACAVSWAADLAMELGARVVAVHALGLLEHERGDPDGHHVASELAAWTSALGALPVSRVDRRVLPGDTVGVLLRCIAEERADLVVAGSRGAGARSERLLGRTSMQLPEQCPFPLVIAPRPALA